MRNSIRLVLLVCAGVLALAASGSAFAAFGSPKLTIQNSTKATAGGGALTITASVAKDDDATARVAIYVPQGYTFTTNQAAGTQIGTVAASVNTVAGANPDFIIPATGVIRTDAAANYAAPAQQCAGTSTPDAVWILALTQPTTLNIPMYVVKTTGAEASFSQAKLVVCLAPPQASSIGAKLLSAKLTLTNVFTNPTANGSYRWRAFFSPYLTNAGPVNPAGTVEVQAVETFPARVQLLSAKGLKKRGKRMLAIRGNVLEMQRGVAGAAVGIYVNGKRVKTVRTGAKGSFATSLRVRKRGTYRVQLRTQVATRVLSGCNATLPTVQACLRTSLSGFKSTSVTLRVRVR